MQSATMLLSFLDAECCVNVCDGGERDASDLLSCPRCLLQCLKFQDVMRFPSQAVMQLLRMLSVVPL